MRSDCKSKQTGGVQWLLGNGFRIYGVVIDGMRGLAQALWPYPVQLCQFHQMLTVKHYMPLLWTFKDIPNIGLPNTNNGLEGIFSDIKTKLRLHSGISREHRKKLIDEYLVRHY